MNVLKRLFTCFIALFLTIAFVACEGDKASSNEETIKAETSKNIEKVTLTVSAAASLKDVMGEIKEQFIAENKNVDVVFNFGSSGALQQQIEQGDGIDIFISAASKQMDALETKQLLQENTRKNIIRNELVLVQSKDVQTISDFKDLTSEKVKKIALGEIKSVPAGQYALEVLDKLKITDAVKKKAIYGNDVKQVLTWVETGDADAGIVYKTDALVSDKVKIVAEATADSHKPIVYPAAAIKSGKNIKQSETFLQFLCLDKAKALFEKYGFAFIGK